MTDQRQSIEALAYGQAIRLERARVRRDVHAQRITVAAALANPVCATAPVVDILAWQRLWGEYRAERFLRENQICTPFAVAGQLTDRQRMLVSRALRLNERQAA